MMRTQKTTVVVADADPQFLRLMTYHLRLEGYQVLSASDGEQALEDIRMHTPALVILDVVLPKLDGWEVCQSVREFSTVPIIFVTPFSRVQDKVHGLDSGADDYLTKPFSADELLARARALLRRAALTTHARLSLHERADDLPAKTTLGDLTVDYAQHQVTLTGREIALTPKEYHLLAILAQHAGWVVPQDALLESVWGKEYVGESHLLQVSINRLRCKLEPDPSHPRYLLTKVGVGYLLTSPR
jgi:DNA-binding response OmpR family regulator